MCNLFAYSTILVALFVHVLVCCLCVFLLFATLDNNEGGVEEGVELAGAIEEEEQGQFVNQGKPPKPFL